MHCLVRVRRKITRITRRDEEIRHFSNKLPLIISEGVRRESLQRNIKVHLEEANIGDLNTMPLEIDIQVIGFSTDQGVCEKNRERIVNGINDKAPSGIKTAVQVFFSN
ncbi:MAG: hypothetical protein ABIF84_00240 [Patescibacteria group bacterium]